MSIARTSRQAIVERNQFAENATFDPPEQAIAKRGRSNSVLEMPSNELAARPPRPPTGLREASRAGWVRKNMVMDQRKLDVARRALGVETETEAIDQALDFVVFREELARGFTAVRRSGGIDDVLEGRRRA